MDLRELKVVKGNAHRHPWELARLKVVTDLLIQASETTKNLKIVDIGCGDLFFLKELSYQFKESKLYAIDSAFTEQQVIDINTTDEFGIKAYQDIKDCEAKNVSIVLLLDVVEHIKDDYAFLNYLNSSPLIGNNTLIAITVPAFQSLFCSHDRFLLHYRRYSNKTLSTLLKTTNFRTIKMGYFFFLLLIPRILNVMIERVKRDDGEATGTGLSFWKGGRFVTTIIKSVLVMDFKFSYALGRIGCTLPGLSNFVICKKNV
ncbi:MAG: methyltransferase type 11 [Gammaproteobacteria bacterium]|nr:hypothetical protein [Flavobacteriaceae bacterium]MCW5584176.1 methyltransferase type 11 [Gammaproteobacteria bacterium]